MFRVLVSGLFFFSSVALAVDDLPVVKNSMPWPILGAGLKDTTQLFNQPASAGVALDLYCFQGAKTGKTIGLPPLHLGIDIAASAGTNVFAIFPGRVVSISDDDSGSGKVVVVESELEIDSRTHLKKKWTTIYSHLTPASNLIVNSTEFKATDRLELRLLGTVVERSKDGDISHLHLGIRSQAFEALPAQGHPGLSEQGCSKGLHNFIDPLAYLRSPNYVLIDNRDPQNSTLPVQWEEHSTAYTHPHPFYFGSNYAALSSDLDGKFTFVGRIAITGKYKIYAKWPTPPGDGANRETAALYALKQGGLQQVSSPVPQNDLRTKGRWVEVLSDVTLAEGPFSIELRSGSKEKDKKIIADAILLEKQ